MKCIARDVEGVHLGIGDLDALRVGAGIKFAPDPQAGRCGRRGDQFDYGNPAGQWLATPGLGDVAEQAVLDLVPLRRSRRKWQTRSVRPVSSASFCSSTLNSRAREPLEPPPSAVIIRRLACGYCSRPITSNQRRIELTANCAVSWSMLRGDKQDGLRVDQDG